MNRLARRQILAVAEQALVKAEAIDVLPTPLDTVGEVSGMLDLLDIAQVPEAVKSSRWSVLRRIIGAYIFQSETAFVDLSQPKGRQRFTQAHEIGHNFGAPHDAVHLVRGPRDLRP